MSRGDTLPKILQGRIAGFICLVFVFSLLSFVLPGKSGATGQITSRSITMSTSNPGVAATYKLSFTPVSSATEIIVDFCNDSPIPGDSCHYDANTVPTIASPTTTGASAGSNGTISTVGTGTPVHTVDITGLTIAASTPYSITIGGITNPATATTFYARILTYGTGNSSGYAPASTSGGTTTTGTYVDAGGDALSTAQNISITAKVFETLQFCVYSGSCGTQAVLQLGASGTNALDTTHAYSNEAAGYNIGTNASSGVNVTMTGTTLCTKSGSTNCPTGASSNTIKAIGGTPAVKNPGTEQFGMCVDDTGATGLTIDGAYLDGTGANCHGITTGQYAGTSTFGFNDSASTGSTGATGGTNSAGGSRIFYSTGPVSLYQAGGFAFIADIASTTPAGIYTTQLNMVATGTF